MGGLAPEITRYEPREALVAGTDGIEVIASVAPAAVAALAPGGRSRWRWARARPARSPS